MRALNDAIRRAEPLTDLEDSPFRALRGTRASTVDVVAQSVAAAAPAGVLAFHTGAMGTGPYGLLELVLTIPLMLGVGAVLGVFTRRLASTGAAYTFVARGLGAPAGIAAGALLAIGYLAVGASTLLSGGRHLAELVSPGDPRAGTLAIVVLAGCAIAAFGAGGLRSTTRLLLVFEIVAVGTVLGFTAMGMAADPAEIARPHWLGDEDAVRGMVSVVVGFVGFESGAALGPETRRPYAAVPRGVMISIVAIAVVLLAGSLGHIVLRVDGPFAESPATRSVLQAIIGVSYLACALAMTMASARLVLAMSREGVLPAALGRVGRRGVPWVASAALAVPVAALPAVAVLLGGEQPFADVADVLGTLGFLSAYVLLCAAAVVFLRRIGESTPRVVALASATGAALLAVLVVWILREGAAEPWPVFVGLAACAAVVGAGVARIVRVPGLRQRVGVYDWAEASDAIAGGTR